MGEPWFYEVEGGKNGPVEKELLESLIERNILSQKTLVWTAGLDEWMPVAQVKALAKLPPPLPTRIKSRRISTTPAATSAEPRKRISAFVANPPAKGALVKKPTPRPSSSAFVPGYSSVLHANLKAAKRQKLMLAAAAILIVGGLCFSAYRLFSKADEPLALRAPAAELKARFDMGKPESGTQTVAK